MSDHSLEVLRSISAVDEAEWNALRRDDYPFLRYDFLLGLENADCTTTASGWEPAHLRLRDGDRTLAILPAFLKSHSYGEYVFDWSWADAWRRMGLEYYPKLVTAMPFTLATGPRLLHASDVPAAHLWSLLREQMPKLAEGLDISSWHVLFPSKEDAELLDATGMHTRHQVQFHWFNRGYDSFDDFLDTFSSRKRKSLRRERRRVAEQGISLRIRNGLELGPEDWLTFHRFYQMTYAKRSGHGGYLTQEFFTDVVAQMGEQVVLATAEQDGRAIAGALYFRDAETLYGRYWGCVQEMDCLHFEACYYQGIEYCIAQGIQRFDPGAQGEHKIQRGFEPSRTYSSHWVARPELDVPIGDFCRSDREHTAQYQRDARELLPFKDAEGQ